MFHRWNSQGSGDIQEHRSQVPTFPRGSTADAKGEARVEAGPIRRVHRHAAFGGAGELCSAASGGQGVGIPRRLQHAEELLASEATSAAAEADGAVRDRAW